VAVTCDNTGCVDPEDEVRVTVNPDSNPVPLIVIVRGKEDEDNAGGLIPITEGGLPPFPDDGLELPQPVAATKDTLKANRKERYKLFIETNFLALLIVTIVKFDYFLVVKKIEHR
jgi:hypothetical protein